MRIEDIVKSNQELPKKCRLNTEDGRQMAILAVLTDISETLAFMTDLYGMSHGHEINPRQRGKQNAEKE